jgi:hypothetical protein
VIQLHAFAPVTTAVASIVVVVLVNAASAAAQSVSGEVVQTVGHSTDDTSAAATQFRLFGEAWSGVRFTAEGAWADRSASTGDAFGAAYPYDGRLKLIEAYADRIFQPGRGIVVVRAGRFRTPFGISSASEYAYAGFLRGPLMRYDNYYALSNNFLEHGASVTAGVPRLFVQAALGVPADVGAAIRHPGLDGVVRAQASFGPFIVGASHISTNPNFSRRFALGRATFTGVDGRWMHGGIAVKGEWLDGQPFDGTRTYGGYVDMSLHRPALGPVTVVARAERLEYIVDSPRAMNALRYTAGARIRVFDTLAVQANVVRQSGIKSQGKGAVDLAVTYVLRIDGTRHK